ncbi:MAG: TIGR03619 family F420-dependent LLM class oxidoreductase [Myxococcota bacterium]
MDIGYFGLNIGTLDNPDSIERVVVTAEQAGFESIWTGEHVVLVDPQVPPSPVPPESTFVDTIASLAFAAAKTERIKLGSGILLLAQRDPVVVAKELASVDVLSKGRLLVGVGVGYVEGEFDALGIPFAERGPRTTEHIDVLRTLWTEEKPAFEGEFTSFSGIQMRPRPVQNPHPPIHVGGMSPPALRRAVAKGDGWYGFFLDVDGTAGVLAQLEETAKSVPRAESLGKIEISVTPPGPVDADTVKRFEDLGVDRLVIMRGFGDMGGQRDQSAEDGIMRFIEETSRDLKLT